MKASKQAQIYSTQKDQNFNIWARALKIIAEKFMAKFKIVAIIQY